MKKLNKVMNDPRISIEAKGIYGYLYSLGTDDAAMYSEIKRMTPNIYEKINLSDFIIELIENDLISMNTKINKI